LVVGLLHRDPRPGGVRTGRRPAQPRSSFRLERRLRGRGYDDQADRVA